MLGKLSGNKKKDFIISLVLLIIIVVAGYYFFNSQVSDLLLDPNKLDEFISGFGIIAPLVFISLMVLQIIFAPIPGHVVYLAGGYVFGVFGGIIYGLIGIFIGTSIAISIGRLLGRPFVEKMVSDENLQKFDDLTYDYGLLAVFVLFLLPGLPDDALCFLVGLTDLKIKKLLVVVVGARGPGLVAMVIAGEQLASSEYLSFLITIAVVAVLSVLAIRYREEIMSFREKI